MPYHTNRAVSGNHLSQHYDDRGKRLIEELQIWSASPDHRPSATISFRTMAGYHWRARPAALLSEHPKGAELNGISGGESLKHRQRGHSSRRQERHLPISFALPLQDSASSHIDSQKTQPSASQRQPQTRQEAGVRR